MLQKLIERVWRPIARNWGGAAAIARAVPIVLRERARRLRSWWRRKKKRSPILREVLLDLKWAGVITASMLLRRWFEQFVGKGWLVESIMNGDFNSIADVLAKGGAI